LRRRRPRWKRSDQKLLHKAVREYREWIIHLHQEVFGGRRRRVQTRSRRSPLEPVADRVEAWSNGLEDRRTHERAPRSTVAANDGSFFTSSHNVYILLKTRDARDARDAPSREPLGSRRNPIIAAMDEPSLEYFPNFVMQRMPRDRRVSIPFYVNTHDNGHCCFSTPPYGNRTSAAYGIGPRPDINRLGQMRVASGGFAGPRHPFLYFPASSGGNGWYGCWNMSGRQGR